MESMQLIKQAWHLPLWQQVENFFKLKRLPHALMLWGQRGLGKQQFAYLLAKKILCLSEHKACDNCQSCHWFNREVHPDFITLKPLENKKTITVEQIRGLQQSLILSATQKAAKVVLISDANLMNIAANNALLKSLEEPNHAIYYLLVSQNLHAIPATINSRCQKLYFSPVNFQIMADYLSNQQFPIEKATLLQGSPLLAKEYLNEQSLNARQVILTTLVDLLESKISPCQAAESWSKQEANFTLEVLLFCFIYLLKTKHGIQNKAESYFKILEKFALLANHLCNIKIFTIIDKIVQLNQHISLARQLNLPLWLDDLAIEIVSGWKIYE